MQGDTAGVLAQIHDEDILTVLSDFRKELRDLKRVLMKRVEE